MLAAINYTHRGKNPQFEDPEEIKSWFRVFNGTFKNTQLAIRQFIASIQEGFSYTTQHRRYRDENNFLYGQHIALDLDTKDERSTFDYLRQDSFILQNASFLHTTPSHTPEEPRCRVVFVLEKALGNREKYKLLAQALVHKYSQDADKSCRDACRLFFGAEGCEVHLLNNTLSFAAAYEHLVKPYQIYLAFEEEERKRREEMMQAVSGQNAPEKFLKAIADGLLKKVVDAAEGERYYTLRNTSIALGGYVAGGYYNRQDAINWLKHAIDQNGGARDIQFAYKAIEESVSFGEKRPLYVLEQPTAAIQSSQLLPSGDPNYMNTISAFRQRKWSLT